MIKRRQLVQLSAGLVACPALGIHAETAADPSAIIKRPIPSTGELVPAIGMGTSRTFDTSGSEANLARLRTVMQAFLDGGGTVIDSSPMYGNAETRVGDILRAMEKQPPLFAATKVWIKGEQAGIDQMKASSQRMNVDTFDLIAVHNLRDWQTHLRTLKRWKSEGKVRYIGITTSHGRDHEDLLEVMATQPLDFVQFSYNIQDREAEQSLLPLARDRGIATMINRPFQRGDLFRKTRDLPLPEMAKDIGCTSWAQFFLKFILAHPAVTCIIPATNKPEHMADNMQANAGQVPGPAMRKEMLRIIEST